MASRVGIHRSDSRSANIRAALAACGQPLIERLQQARSILLKPNLVHHSNALANVPAASAAAVVEFIRDHTDAPIVIGEASYFDTEDAFTQFGYRALAQQFSSVSLLDFNRGATVPGTLYHAGLREHRVHVARAVAEADVRISLAPMKTHNHFILTLAIKNWVVGIIVAKKFPGTKTWQRWPHFHLQGYRVSHESAVRILRDFPMQLAVLDGWEGMEGNGPTSGQPVPLHLALAGLDPVAVDATAARIMGFDPPDIGYLVFAARDHLGSIDASDIEVVGNATIREVKKTFQPHPHFHHQLAWKDERQGRWRSLVDQITKGP